MNWALLDIRTGRVNRLQFLAILSVSQILLLVGYLSNIAAVKIILSLPAYYLVFLVFSRRLKDMDIGYKNFLIVAFVLSFIMVLFTNGYNIIIAFSSPNLSLGLYFLGLPFYTFYKFVIISLFNPLVTILYFKWRLSLGFSGLAFLGIYSFFIFKKGDSEQNKYGLPPKGLDFRTMISEAYPNAEQLENNNEPKNIPEQVEFKGRE